MNGILIASLLVFAAVVTAVIGVILNREGKSARELGRRLLSLALGSAVAKREHQIERDDRYSSLPLFDRLLRSINVGRNIEQLIYKAGMDMRPGVLILLIATLAIGGYLLAAFFFHRVAAGLLGMAMCGPMPWLYVAYRKHVRMKAFAREFPDAIDLLVSALRAGLSFTAAMQIVSEESPEPVRSEFAITVEEQALGIDFREALTNFTERIDSLDLRFFVTAVLLQRDTGGNLAEILASTANLIRDRFRVLGDIATFTAQGRLTGAILALLPLGMALFMFATAPEYFKPFIEIHQGRVALAVAGGMQILGTLIIKKIVSIRV